jgi:hypothetical protein
MNNFKTTAKLAILALASTLVVSCGSTDNKVDNGPGYNETFTGEGGTQVIREWWKRPGALGKYAAIGTAKIIGNEASARNRADVDARNKLAASIKATIQSISENWSQEAGDLTDESTLSSMMNDETFIRQVVDTTLVGSVVDRYESNGGYMYVLMKLESPDDFLAHLVSKVDENSKQDDALAETNARKSILRDRLDTVIEREKGQISAEKAKTAKALGE